MKSAMLSAKIESSHQEQLEREQDLRKQDVAALRQQLGQAREAEQRARAQAQDAQTQAQTAQAEERKLTNRLNATNKHLVTNKHRQAEGASANQTPLPPPAFPFPRTLRSFYVLARGVLWACEAKRSRVGVNLVRMVSTTRVRV